MDILYFYFFVNGIENFSEEGQVGGSLNSNEDQNSGYAAGTPVSRKVLA